MGIDPDGQEQYVFHGVTSVENPLEVNADTLFQIGSTTKTFTATAVMRLVEQGKVSLSARVRNTSRSSRPGTRQSPNESPCFSF